MRTTLCDQIPATLRGATAYRVFHVQVETTQRTALAVVRDESTLSRRRHFDGFDDQLVADLVGPDCASKPKKNGRQRTSTEKQRYSLSLKRVAAVAPKPLLGVNSFADARLAPKRPPAAGILNMVAGRSPRNWNFAAGRFRFSSGPKGAKSENLRRKRARAALPESVTDK